MASSKQENQSIKVKVLAVKTKEKVSRWQIKDFEVIPMDLHVNREAAVSDGKKVFKFIVFNQWADYVQKGKFIIIRNYGLGDYGKRDTILSRRNTKIYDCNPFQVSQDLEDEGAFLLEPPSKQVSLKDVEGEDCLYITVQGFVVGLEPFKSGFEGNGKLYPKRTITIMMDGDQIPVVLWREANLTRLNVGTLVQLSHLIKRNDGKGGFSLNSTGATDVNVADVAFEIEVDGLLRCPGGEFELLDSRNIPFTVPAKLWEKAFPNPTSAIPKTVRLVYKMGELQEVTGVTPEEKEEKEKEQQEKEEREDDELLLSEL